MNLYVISFKSVYDTLKNNLKWRRYKISNSCLKHVFLAEKKLRGADEGWRRHPSRVSFFFLEGISRVSLAKGAEVIANNNNNNNNNSKEEGGPTIPS